MGRPRRESQEKKYLMTRDRVKLRYLSWKIKKISDKPFEDTRPTRPPSTIMGNGASDEGAPAPEPDAFSGPASMFHTSRDWSPPAYTSSSSSEEPPLIEEGGTTAHAAPPAAKAAAPAAPAAARRRGSSGVVIVRDGTNLEVRRAALRGLVGYLGGGVCNFGVGLQPPSEYVCQPTPPHEPLLPTCVRIP